MTCDSYCYCWFSLHSLKWSCSAFQFLPSPRGQFRRRFFWSSLLSELEVAVEKNAREGAQDTDELVWGDWIVEEEVSSQEGDTEFAVPRHVVTDTRKGQGHMTYKQLGRVQNHIPMFSEGLFLTT